MTPTVLAREDPVRHEEEELDQELQKMPLRALSRRSRDVLCELLDPQKIIPSPEGYDRYWPGLARLARIPGQYNSGMRSSARPTDKVLELWAAERTGAPCTLGQLQHFLQCLDRWDVYTDTYPYFKKDAEEYLQRREAHVSAEPPAEPLITCHDTRDHKQRYHAFVLFAEADREFAEEMIDRLQNQRLLVCTREELLAGWSMELEALARLIQERCNHVIVIFSPAFVSSNEHKFLVDSAMSNAIRNNSRMLIPVMYRYPCAVPLMCANLTKIFYKSSDDTSIVNFWDRLVRNIDASFAARPMVLESARGNVAPVAAEPAPPSAAAAALTLALPSPPTHDLTSAAPAAHTGARPKKFPLLDKIIKRKKNKNKSKEQPVSSAC